MNHLVILDENNHKFIEIVIFYSNKKEKLKGLDLMQTFSYEKIRLMEI